MVAPALLLVTVFILVPIGIAIYLSMTDWDGFSPSPDFIGLKNYRDIFHDSGLVQAAVVTGVITVAGTVAANALGLGTAMLVNGAGRLNAVARGVMFYPYIIGAIIIGFLWSAILGSNGAIDSVLQALGSLPYGPWWPGLDEVIEAARTFYPGRLAEGTVVGR